MPTYHTSKKSQKIEPRLHPFVNALFWPVSSFTTQHLRRKRAETQATKDQSALLVLYQNHRLGIKESVRAK